MSIYMFVIIKRVDFAFEYRMVLLIFCTAVKSSVKALRRSKAKSVSVRLQTYKDILSYRGIHFGEKLEVGTPDTWYSWIGYLRWIVLRESNQSITRMGIRRDREADVAVNRVLVT